MHPPPQAQPPQQPVTPQPQPQPHHPHLLHSKSQSNIPSPIRNFLHDERLLNQNIFNQFSIPSTFNNNAAIPPPHLPRAHSTSVLPSYKMDSAGNVVPVNPPVGGGLPPSYPLARNSQDPKKINRITPTGLPPTNFTGPSSLPTGIYPRGSGSGSGSGSGGITSASPPKGGGQSPFSTPPISPNPSTGPATQGNLPVSAIPLLPLSTSPPNISPYTKVEIPTPSKEAYRRHPSEPRT